MLRVGWNALPMSAPALQPTRQARKVLGSLGLQLHVISPGPGYTEKLLTRMFFLNQRNALPHGPCAAEPNRTAYMLVTFKACACVLSMLHPCRVAGMLVIDEAVACAEHAVPMQGCRHACHR